jgi:alpha-glucosidase
VERDDPDSVLTLYNDALRIRRAHPAFGDGDMEWLDSPPDVLMFRREPGLVCVVNFADAPFSLPGSARTLLESESLHDGKLPCDTAVWLED